MEINSTLGSLRASMEEIRQRESQKAIIKLNHVDAKTIKTIDNMTKSIVNKIFYDISENIKESAQNNDEDIVKLVGINLPENGLACC